MHAEWHFERFYDRVRLDDKRDQRIRGAVARLAGHITEDPLHKFVVSELMPQGSWAQGTIVKPRTANPDFDVDLLLPMNFNAFPLDKRTPNEILSYVRSRLKRHYGAQVRARDKCVRIQYGIGDDFHIDVVPGHVISNVAGPFHICSKKQGFITSDPAVMTNWVREMDARTGGHFSRAVVCLKRWRDIKMGSAGPKSILLTCLAGQSYLKYEGNKGLWSTAHETLEAFTRDLVVCMRAHLESGPSGIVIPGSRDDLYAPWSQASHDKFLRHLRAFEQRAEKALNQRNVGYTVGHWQSLFGNAFPSAAST